ncbi:SCO6745 family protein [Nonomuraea sp. CA-143628]|uniref:SCO6745 family protein n=1 Tax=Nonomuraea sp. CA-143628 TaxID=3239997 RepID=UPI003D90239B
MSIDGRLARRMWHQLEPIHAALYFSPQAFEEAAAIGYDVESRWPSYFAYRTAPLGHAGTNLAFATYYSFSPRTIAEHVPAVWDTASPAEVLPARHRAVDRTYRTLLGDGVEALGEAAELARRVAESVTVGGRPFAAANLDLPWPDEPHLALWHAATVLREHRGDGHLVALQAAELDPCESLVSLAAIGGAPVANFAGRGWSESEWAAAQDRLAGRGLVDAEGQATDQGRALRDQVERMTDDLAAEPWRQLGEQRADRLAQLIQPVLGAVFEAGILPMTSTLGIATVKVPD